MVVWRNSEDFKPTCRKQIRAEKLASARRSKAELHSSAKVNGTQPAETWIADVMPPAVPVLASLSSTIQSPDSNKKSHRCYHHFRCLALPLPPQSSHGEFG